MRKKVILYMTDGNNYTIYPKNNSQYESLMEEIQNGELLKIDKGNGKIITIRSTNIEYFEEEIY